MRTKLFLILSLMLGGTVLSNCGPAVGAAGTVAADEAYEEETGEELF